MPVQPNVFKLEMTPPLPTLDPDKTCTMTLKNLATTRQRVLVTIESALFQLHNTNKYSSQDYAIVEPGATWSFHIEHKRAGMGIHIDYRLQILYFQQGSGPKKILSRMTKPEGKLQIYHQTTNLIFLCDDDWDKEYYEEDIDYYNPEYTLKMDLKSEVEWGLVEIELSCEKETNLMKKQRKQFNKMKKKLEKKNNCIIS